jgi:hypothetical protein
VSKVLILLITLPIFPEIKVCQTLATQASVFNISWWFYGSQEKFDAGQNKINYSKKILTMLI